MMHHRLTVPKTSSQDHQTALQILRTGAVTLLSRAQAQAGTALALLAVKHCVDYKEPVTDANVASFRQIADAYTVASPDVIAEEVHREKLRFLKSAVSWSSLESCAGFKNGHATLNSTAAKAAVDVADYKLAESLFINSDDPTGCAEFLHAWAVKDMLPSEHALILTKLILSYIIAENLKDAEIVRSTFFTLSGWKSVEQTTQSSSTPPLGNFCEILLRVCQRGSAAAALYQRLCSTYDPELQRDETIAPLLKTIGTKYFNIQPPAPTGLGGMMNSMLRGMMGS